MNTGIRGARRTRTSFKNYVSFACLLAASLPAAAYADCTASTTGTVDCTTTTTVNIVNLDGADAVSSDNEYIYDTGDPVVATIESGAAIDGVGLWFEQDAAGGALNIVNNGSVTNGTPGDGIFGFGNGGLLTYSGNGSAFAPDVTSLWTGLLLTNRNGGDIDVGTALAPITGSFTGTVGLYAGVRGGSADIVGDVTVYANGGTYTGLANSMSIAVGLWADASSGSGNAFVQTTGHSVFLSPVDGRGIQADASTGTATIISDANVGTALANVGVGLRSSSTSNNVSVTQNSGAIYAAIAGDRVVTGGAGTATVAVSGAASVVATGATATGILTNAADGATTVTLSGSGTHIAAASGTGIGLNSGTGNINLTVGAGTMVSGGTAALALVTTSGDAVIDNSGTINATGASTLIMQTGGSTTFNNHAGTVFGKMVLGGTTGADKFVNDATWNTSGASTFGTGADTITNHANGVISVAGCALSSCTFSFAGSALDTITNAGTMNLGMLATDGVAFTFSSNAGNIFTNTGHVNVGGTATFAGLSSFANASGFLDLRQSGSTNSNTGSVTLSGAFSGGTGSKLGLDVYLGDNTSTSDKLHVTGAVTGTTDIVIADTNTGGGGYTGPTGITLVTVAGANTDTNFELSASSTVNGGHYQMLGGVGVLEKGLFTYYLSHSANTFSLVSAPNELALQSPIAVIGAQTIWYETALGWEDRKQAAIPGTNNDTGFWLTPVGSWTSRSDHASFTNGGTTFNYNLGYDQNVWGILGGVDKKIIPSSLWTFGLFGGYAGGDLSFNTTTLTGSGPTTFPTRAAS